MRHGFWLGDACHARAVNWLQRRGSLRAFDLSLDLFLPMSTLADEFLADLEEDELPQQDAAAGGGADAMQISTGVTVKKEKMQEDEEENGAPGEESSDGEEDEDAVLDEMVVESTLKLKSVRQLIQLSEQKLNQLLEVRLLAFAR